MSAGEASPAQPAQFPPQSAKRAHRRQVTPQPLFGIEHSVNNRPRRILGSLTPVEAFAQLELNHIAGVALQA